MRYITEYCRLNQKLSRNTYPIPRIFQTTQKLERFQYATALDLNMGYYAIRLYLAKRDMMTNVTEFGKLRYNRLSMGMCALGDIFQAKLYELLGDIEGVKTYPNRLIVDIIRSL